MFRQGDVLLVPVGKLILGADRKIEAERGRLILARGEATGHAHAVSAVHADLYEIERERFLEVRQSTSLMHEEHDWIELPPGVYKIVQQREYTPQEIRFVRD